MGTGDHRRLRRAARAHQGSRHPDPGAGAGRWTAPGDRRRWVGSGNTGSNSQSIRASRTACASSDSATVSRTTSGQPMPSSSPHVAKECRTRSWKGWRAVLRALRTPHREYHSFSAPAEESSSLRTTVVHGRKPSGTIVDEPTVPRGNSAELLFRVRSRRLLARPERRSTRRRIPTSARREHGHRPRPCRSVMPVPLRSLRGPKYPFWWCRMSRSKSISTACL